MNIDNWLYKVSQRISQQRERKNSPEEILLKRQNLDEIERRTAIVNARRERDQADSYSRYRHKTYR